MKKVNILRITDVITNSSSEVFCIINSEDIHAIYELLSELIPGYDPEIDASLDFDGNVIQLRLPYSLCQLESFFKYGIEAILKENFKNYEIKYY